MRTGTSREPSVPTRKVAIAVPSPPLEVMSDTMRQGLRSNKRCRNDRLIAAGYAFRYRSFRTGYAAFLTANGV